jgi:hypothetical protein
MELLSPNGTARPAMAIISSRPIADPNKSAHSAVAPGSP